MASTSRASQLHPVPCTASAPVAIASPLHTLSPSRATMFNALNRFIARLDGDAPAAAHDDSHGAFGFQVLRNTNAQLPIEPWFDFVVGINGRVLDDSDPLLFAQEVRNCAGGTVSLELWSAKGQRTRTLHVPVPPDTASLGLALQWTPLSVVSTIWHVLDVPSHSPADAAGLLPFSDYILGTPEGVLHGESGLGELVEDHIGRPLRLWVYNNEYDVTREVTIQPSRDWGGAGALGCVLGYGALHRLPAPLSGPVAGPGEMLFDGGGRQTPAATSAAAPPTMTTTTTTADDFEPAPPSSSSGAATAAAFVPAELAAATTATTAVPVLTTGSMPARSKKKHHHAAAAPAVGLSMDDYFKEEEAKSQALDSVPSRHATPLAPPPKGPPRAATPKGGGTDDGAAAAEAKEGE